MNFINKIGLGTVQFGIDYGISNSTGKTPKAEVKNILQYAAGNGIDVLDTAAAYGQSEEVLGESDLSSFKIVSKFSPGSISTQLASSLDKLNVCSLYGYIAHRPLSILEDVKTWHELQQYKADNKVEKVGFSFNELDEMNRVLDAGFVPDLVQVPFNYFDRRFLTRMKELKEAGCEIHSRSTFLQGLFFCDVSKLSGYFDEVKDLILELSKYGDKLPALLLKWVLENEFIDKVIVGINDAEQLKNNIDSIAASDGNLKPLDRKISDNIVTPSRWPKTQK